MTALDPTLPPPMFDVGEDGELNPPVFESAGHGVGLTPYGRHHGLGPGVFGGSCCDLALYGSVESSGRRVWIYHVCSRTGLHLEHKCDRCPETWAAA